MTARMRLPSKSGTFLILMTASCVSAFILPEAWTSWIRRPFQLTGLVSWGVSGATRTVRERVAEAHSDAEDRLQARIDELQRQVLNQQVLLGEMQTQLDHITGIRDQMPFSNVSIVLAEVTGFDADPQRESLQIKVAGDLYRRLRPGQWVAAGRPRSEREGASGLEFLPREWLIGRISEVHNLLARVQLATDPAFRTLVRVGQVTPADETGAWGLTMTPDRWMLQGQGEGRMLITQAEANYYEQGLRVVGVPPSRELPTPFVLGRLVGARRREDSPMHYDLQVEPWGSVESLSHVYVLTTVAP